MGYAIDRRLIRLAGDLLANGAGRFTATDTRSLFRGAMQDRVLLPQETTAVLVVYATVISRADADATRMFDDVVKGARNDDPDLEPWIVHNLSGRLLGRAAALIAGRKRRRVSRSEITGLMSDAYQGGKSQGFPETKRWPFSSFASCCTTAWPRTRSRRSTSCAPRSLKTESRG